MNPLGLTQDGRPTLAQVGSSRESEPSGNLRKGILRKSCPSMIQATPPASGVPSEVLASILRKHLADPSVTISDCISTPFPHQGTNDSTSFLRVSLTWQRPTLAQDVHTATWIVKQWQAGGVRDGTLGITQSREVLAWEQGWLHPRALPPGLIVPLIGVQRAPDNRSAWLAMADVSTELATYPRLSLTGDQVIRRARTILSRLASFHARWEQSEHRAELAACGWLRRPQDYLWDMAPTYAAALGRPPLAQTSPAAAAPPVWDGLSADLATFLAARPADERRLWESLLIDRRGLVEGLADYPPTLLHGDLDDRNMGLRGLDTHDSIATPSDLVLIDWEWLALGPAALDVANIVQRLPIMIMPGTPIPETIWSNGFADDYFAHYRAAGGRCTDRGEWQRAFGLALVAQGIAQMPFMHGQLRRAVRGDCPLPQIVGVPEAVIRQNLQAGLPMMERMEERVISAARRWVG